MSKIDRPHDDATSSPAPSGLKVQTADTGNNAHSAKEANAMDADRAHPDEECLRRMITFTKREAERNERTFCAYLLDLALNALDEDSEEMNSALRARFASTPLGSASDAAPAAMPRSGTTNGAAD